MQNVLYKRAYISEVTPHFYSISQLLGFQVQVLWITGYLLQPAFMPDFQGFWLVFHTRALVQQCTWNLSNGDILKTYVLISGLIDCFLDRIGNWKRPFSCTSRFPNTLEKRVSSLWQCVWAVYYNMWIFGSCLLQRVAQCYKQVLWTSAFFQKVSDLETYFSGKGGLNVLLISYIEME